MVRELAPAKLNLVLHVGPPDGGMHPIASLFASLELADELEVEEAAPGASRHRRVSGRGGREPRRGRTARVPRTGRRSSFRRSTIRIHKRIPIAAGLGGGSADAAAALRAANRIAGAPFDADQLRALAARLGSDVPSQVEPRHAVVTGTGEVVEPIELPPVDLVLLPDPRGLSAAEVYAELDRREGWRQQLDPAPLRKLAGADAHTLADVLDNDLGPAAIALLPEVEGALDSLRAAGALGAGVSGSGPTCFGLFDSEAAAERAATAIRGAIATRLRSA